MSQKIWIGITALNLCATSILPSGAWAKGGETSGGGDEYVADFVQTVNLEILPLIQNNADLKKVTSAKALLGAADPKRAVSQDRVFESCDGSSAGREVEMCYNADEDMFYISRSKYPLHRTNSPAKRAVVTHELFRRLRLEGDGYELTKKMSFYTPNAKALDFEVLSSNEEYLRQFPSMGIDQVILTSAWYRLDASGASKAKNEVQNFLKENLKTGASKAVMEQMIEYEYKQGCDKNVDYQKIKETSETSSSYSYNAAGVTATRKGSSAGLAHTEQTISSNRFSGATSSYSENVNESFSDNYSLEVRDVYCQRPSQWIRAVLKATTKIQSLDADAQRFFISRHIARSIESFTRSTDGFLKGIDSIILNPAISPVALRSKFQQSDPNFLQSWVAKRMSRIESGKKYVELLNRLYSKREYSDLAENFLAMVTATAERISQVESPGLYAVVENDAGSAEKILLISANQLRKLDPSLSFQGVVLNNSKITPQFLASWSQAFECDVAYLSLYDSVKEYPVEPILPMNSQENNIRYTESRTPMATRILQCSNRYTQISRNAKVPYSAGDSAFELYSFNKFMNDYYWPMDLEFVNRGCIPFASRPYTESSHDLFKENTAVVMSVCPIQH